MTEFTVGAFEAKTQLSSLLDRVAAGEEVVITKHGKPVTRLVSAARVDRERVPDAFLARVAGCGAPVSALVMGADNDLLSRLGRPRCPI